LDPETHYYEFGPYRIDTTERLLRLGDELISLPPKVIDTLLVLVSNSGRMVEKMALMQAVWPDTNVVENALTKNISLLRQTFDHSSDEPRTLRPFPSVATGLSRSCGPLPRLLTSESRRRSHQSVGTTGLP
jgi:DNA-binding winged helix-turn-helix (wHTH) protein